MKKRTKIRNEEANQNRLTCSNAGPSISKRRPLVFLMSFVCVGVMGCAGGRIRSEEAGALPLNSPLSLEKKPAEAESLKKLSKNADSQASAPKINMEASAEYHFSMAQAYVAEGNPDRAIEEYKLTLMFDPNSSLVYVRLATEYIKKGMLSAAMEACKEALQRDPNFTDARLLLAGLYSSSRDADAAVAEYDRILKAHPQHEEAVVYKAQVLIEEGRSEQAVEALRQFVKKNHQSAVAYFYLGKAEQGMHRFKEAVSAYRKAMEIRTPFNQAALALGMLYEEQGMNPQAVATYKELFEATQDAAAAHRLTAIYLKEEKYRQSLPYLESLAASDPDDMNAKVKLGLVQMELKQYDKAISTFKGIVAKNPDAERVYYYLGSIYEELKQNDAAIEELKKINPGSKLYTTAVLHTGYLMKQQGKMDEAKAYVKESIARSPNVSSFYIFQASLEEDSRDVAKAIDILEDAAKRFGEDEKVRYYLGSLYDRKGNVEKGLEQMEAILKINPDNVDALNYIGYTWTIQGVRLNEAEALLKRAIALKPDNGYIKDSWGWHLFVRGRLDEAIVALEKAASLKPNESVILEHLADVYLRSNLPEKAIVRYRDAVKYAESDELKRKIASKLSSLETALAQKGKREGAPERMPAGGSK